MHVDIPRIIDLTIIILGTIGDILTKMVEIQVEFIPTAPTDYTTSTGVIGPAMTTGTVFLVIIVERTTQKLKNSYAGNLGMTKHHTEAGMIGRIFADEKETIAALQITFLLCLMIT